MTQEPTEEAVPWTELTWHGLPMLRCTLCPWDTLDGEAAMIAHIAARHGVREAAPRRQPLVQAYDVWGNPK